MSFAVRYLKKNKTNNGGVGREWGQWGAGEHVRIPVRFEDLQYNLFFPASFSLVLLVLFVSISLPSFLFFQCSCIAVTVGAGFASLYLFTWTAWEKSI